MHKLLDFCRKRLIQLQANILHPRCNIIILKNLKMENTENFKLKELSNQLKIDTFAKVANK